MSEFQIAHLDDIHVTAASGTALSSANKLEALKSCSFTTSVEHVELKHLNSVDGWSNHEAVWSSATGTLAGEAKKDSETQQVLADALENRTPFYVHLITNAAATTGEKKGKRYHVSIESGEEPREAGALVTFSYSLKVKGKPVDILSA